MIIRTNIKEEDYPQHWDSKGINHDNDAELAHIGVLGMRWGTRRSEKRTNKLAKKVDKSMRKFDRGKKGVTGETFREQSVKVRSEAYKTNKRMARMNRYLDKRKGETVDRLIFKSKVDPQKVAMVKEYLARNQVTSKTLSEVRSSLIDIKIDTL